MTDAEGAADPLRSVIRGASPERKRRANGRQIAADGCPQVEVDPLGQRPLVGERQAHRAPAPARLHGERGSHHETAGGKAVVGVVVQMQRHPQLSQLIPADRATRSGAHGLHRRQQQRHQHAKDRNHDQEFNQRNAAAWDGLRTHAGLRRDSIPAWTGAPSQERCWASSPGPGRRPDAPTQVKTTLPPPLIPQPVKSSREIHLEAQPSATPRNGIVACSADGLAAHFRTVNSALADSWPSDETQPAAT